jgi:hypothetical protein
MPSERVRNAIIAVVTTVWAVNFAAGLVLEDYEPDQAINAIFMAIVGGLFAIGARHEKRGDDQ